MQQIGCVIAVFKDERDVQLWEAYLDGISALWCITAEEDLEQTLAKMHGMRVEPGLVILSGALYPEVPELASRFREFFPGAEIMLISSSEEPAPPMRPLLQDQVRHLAINPPAADRKAKGYFESVLQKLVAGRPWEITSCLAPATAIATFELSSSDEKEGVIVALEEALGGDAPELEMLRQRGALLADELLENAIYGAPRGEDGGKLFGKGERRATFPGERLVFRFGFDGKTLALEMTDSWGTLKPEQVMHYLSANQEGDLEGDQGGRGLFIIWRFFDHFHVSITPGEKTVVSGDLSLVGDLAPEAPRGFHITTHNKEA